jgi:hypothetical protein
MSTTAVCPGPPPNPTTCATLSDAEAKCCGLDGTDTANWPDTQNTYRCFQCTVPSNGGDSQPLLTHDLVGANGQASSVHVHLAILTQEPKLCSEGSVGSAPLSALRTGKTCDSAGNEFEYKGAGIRGASNPISLTRDDLYMPAFTSSSFFPGPAQKIFYYDRPAIKQIFPRTLPLNTSASLLVGNSNPF